MTKTILLAMAITATLILSMFTMAANAFGLVFDEPGTYAIKTNVGNATCETTEGVSCGVGTAKTQFRLLITDVEDGFSTGIAQGVISMHGITDDNRKIERTFNNLLLEYDSNGRFLSIAGNDNEWRINAAGTVGEFKNGKAKIELGVYITNPVGVSILAESLKGYITDTNTPLKQVINLKSEKMAMSLSKTLEQFNQEHPKLIVCYL